MISIIYHPLKADDDNEYICKIGVDGFVLTGFPLDATICEQNGKWDDTKAQEWLALNESIILGEARNRAGEAGIIRVELGIVLEAKQMEIDDMKNRIIELEKAKEITPR